MALLRALSLLLLAAIPAQACLLPPHGCFEEVCNSIKDFIIPSNSGQDFSNLTTWTGNPTYSKLAFIRTSFNKIIGTSGPTPFTPETWLDMLNGLKNVKAGPPSLPSVNYEFYTLDGSEYVAAPLLVEGHSPGASVAECCHGCRLTKGCAMYAFVPNGKPTQLTSKAGGSCYFISDGVDAKDGPFDFTDGSNQYSPRTNNLKSLHALTRAETRDALKSPSSYPTFKQMFLGGYCNPHTYPNGTVTDDPHFIGAHGTRFDFNGELDKSFCLVTDRGLTINVVLRGYKNDNMFGATETAEGKAVRSWIKEVGIVWKGEDNVEHTLRLVARTGKEQSRSAGFLAKAELDGAPLGIPQAPGSMTEVGDLSLSFVNTFTKGRFDIDKFVLTIGSRLNLAFNMRVAHPKLQTANDAEVHFNLMINNMQVTESVHGVLGQTYRNSPSQVTKAVKYQELTQLIGGPVKADGESGAGFLEGSVRDYETSDVLKSDCKVSSY